MDAVAGSCDPNALTGNFNINTFTMNCYAKRGIQKDEEILVSYCCPTDPYEVRQRALVKYGFTCECSKCLDERYAQIELFVLIPRFTIDFIPGQSPIERSIPGRKKPWAASVTLNVY